MWLPELQKCFGTFIVIITSYAFPCELMSIFYISCQSFLCIIPLAHSVSTFVSIIFYIYECIVSVCYVNPANDSIWNTCFRYCHGPGYDHHLYVQILWNFLSKDGLINTWFISNNNKMFRNSERIISGRCALLGLCWMARVDLWKIWSFDFRLMKNGWLMN